MLQIIDRLHELLQKGLPKDAIKEYYVGKPDNLSTLLMPCIYTRISGLGVKLGPTGMDVDTYAIEMRLLFPKSQGVSNQHSKGNPASYRRAMDLINKINFDGVSYATRQQSIVEVLRSHIFMSGDTIHTNTSEILINNDIQMTTDDSAVGDKTYIEARFVFTAWQYIAIPTRI